MADLNVQPKKKSSILPWVLLALGLIALLFLLSRGCNKDNDATPVRTDTVTTADTNTTATTTTTTTTTANDDWSRVDRNAAPVVNYEEITNKDIEVRGTNEYSVYGLGENILFDENKATIRPDAEANLKQIVASIGKRHGSGQVRIYGHTDAQGSAGANQELSAQRAEAVRSWLTQNGLGADRISLHPQGESNPVGSNATEAGRQQNRRVEIVARG